MGLVGGHDDIMKLFGQKEAFRIAAIAAHKGDMRESFEETHPILKEVAPDPVA